MDPLHTGYLMYPNSTLRIAQPQTKVMELHIQQVTFLDIHLAHQAMGSTIGVKIEILMQSKGKPYEGSTNIP